MKAIEILKQTLELQDLVHGVETIAPNESVSQFVNRIVGKCDYVNDATFDRPIDFYYIFGKPIKGIYDIHIVDEEEEDVYFYMIGEF